MLVTKKIKNRGVLFSYDSFLGCNLNMYLIKGIKFNYIIDTGLGASSLEPVKELLKNEKKATIVINTHYHWDHIWGNNEYKDSVIISHVLCREIIEKKWDEMMEKNRDYCFGPVAKCLPNVVFESELYFPGDNIRLLHTPGHTMDSISVFDEEEKIIILGDNIGDTIDEIIPSIDCEEEVYIKTMKRYMQMEFDTCISGHNVVLGKEVIGEIIKTFV